MSNAHYLMPLAETAQHATDDFRNPATNTHIDLIENKRWHPGYPAQHRLDRQ
jgi:hypothetical protein